MSDRVAKSCVWLSFSHTIRTYFIFVPISYFRKSERPKKTKRLTQIKVNKYNRSRIGSDRPRLQWLSSPHSFFYFSLSRWNKRETESQMEKIILTQQEHWHDRVPANSAIKCDAWVRLDTSTAIQRTKKSSVKVLTNRQSIFIRRTWSLITIIPCRR